MFHSLCSMIYDGKLVNSVPALICNKKNNIYDQSVAKRVWLHIMTKNITLSCLQMIVKLKTTHKKTTVVMEHIEIRVF